MAAPFGPPPVRAMTRTLPSELTRVSVPRLISTRTTLPSGIAIGPSGNSRPLASSRSSAIAPPSLDRHQRTAGTVQLVEVLGDPVALEPLARPAGESLVDDRSPIARLVRDAGDAEDVAAERGHASPGVGRAQVDGSLGEAVGGELGREVPAADARVLGVAPDPPAMQIARVGADPDAAQVDVVAQVDREPAPHARPAPAARPPRLVTVAARLDQLVAHALRL